MIWHLLNKLALVITLRKRREGLATGPFEHVDVVREGDASIGSDPPVERHLALGILSS